MATAKRPRATRSAEASATGKTGRAATETVAIEADSPALETITGYLLRRAHYVYHAYWLSHFRATETPITPMQAGVLLMLQRYPDVNQSELGRLMGIEAPTAFNLVAKLERPGYIQRVQHGSDKRAQMIQLTPAGHQILKAITELIPTRDADLMAGFTPAERTVLAKLLVRIIVNGNEHLGISQQVVSAAAAEAAISGEASEDAAARKARAARPTKWRTRRRIRD